MKLLLDENLPRKLKYRFPASVPEMKWSGIKNGELLEKTKSQDLNVLITIDKNFSHQQNLISFSICLIVLKAKDNRYETLLKFMPKLLAVWTDTIEPRVVILEQ